MAGGDSCSLTIEAGDTIAYSTKELSAPASCDEVTVTLSHTGQFPKEAMGHNWVLIPTEALDAIANAGMAAGAGNDYLPEDDRIIAATKLVGGGQTASVTFSTEGLSGGYSYICTFPGHWAIMRGTFTVEG
ncbi:MAG: azurin [Lysobacterales bacterium]